MEKAIAKSEDLPVSQSAGPRMDLTVKDVVSRREKIFETMKHIMKQDVDYGIIPGCQKPSLLKPGAEKLASVFMLAASPVVESESTADEIRYRVTVEIIHQTTGAFLGKGIGEASTNEDKYKWRKAVCDEEYQATDPDRRREKYKTGQNGTYTVKQVRMEPSDLANTVLKMAKKRALVDAILTVTAASDIFTQDLEDLPAEYIQQKTDTATKPVSKPARKSESQAVPEGDPFTIRGVVTNYWAPKGKGPHTCKVNKGEEYYKTFDAELGATLVAHQKVGDTVELTGSIVTKDGYTNRMIASLATIQEYDGDTKNPEEPPMGGGRA